MVQTKPVPLSATALMAATTTIAWETGKPDVGSSIRQFTKKKERKNLVRSAFTMSRNELWNCPHLPRKRTARRCTRRNTNKTGTLVRSAFTRIILTMS